MENLPTQGNKIGTNLTNSENQQSQLYSIKKIVELSRNGDSNSLASLKSLRTLEKEKGITKLNAAILALLIDLVNSFNVGKTMNVEQVKTASELIFFEKPYLSIPDLKICFRNAKMGKYGKLYDSIDCATIFGFIDQYEKEKTEIAEHTSFKAHIEHKQEERKPMCDESKRILNEIKEKLNAQIIQEKNFKREVKDNNKSKSEYYDPIPNFISQFDKLHKKWGYKPKANESNAVKFIVRFSRIISLSEFLEMKAKQHDKVMMYLCENSATNQ